MEIASPIVTFTFDDGRRSAIVQGSRILEKYHAKGTFYPITSCIGKSNKDGEYADWHEIMNIAEAGHEIGNHTHTHSKTFTSWTKRALFRDIFKADKELLSHGITSTSLAYPYGNYNALFQEVLTELNFRAARTIDHGINESVANKYLLQSVMVEKRHTLEDIEKAVEKTIEKRGWLILCFHHLDDNTGISTPPELFEEMVAMIASRKIPILPLSKVLHHYDL